MVGPADGHAPTLSDPGLLVAAVRLIVARCEVRYTGRLTAVLPEALAAADAQVRRVGDGARRHRRLQAAELDDAAGRDRGGAGPDGRAQGAGATEDRLEIVISEVVSDVTHDMGEAAALEKEGVERELQELLADARPEGLRLVRRE